ncbi:MAG TPA: FecR family protein [Daejeonella sp.]|uniref:FecR family protein n=1 Tax=Daejeonella sp. TaxID=2805397 RepID=UPI002ED8908D
MNQNKLDELLSLFAEGKISRDEFDHLFDYLRSEADDDSINYAIDQELGKMKKCASLTDGEKDAIFQNILTNDKFGQEPVSENSGNHVVRAWYQIGVAASILAMLTVGLYFYTNRTIDTQLVLSESQIIKEKSIIKPGGDKAVLTLSDGSKIILEDAKKGLLANQAGVSIQKTADGELLYSFAKNLNSVSEALPEEVIYNKIETPFGGKYQINLPDGSKVWLNSASTLRFPALFSGNTREVELNGEAYFDVAKNPNKPFKVITKDQIVEVLGTQFNINSYSDEETFKTTLIEGSVKIIYKDRVVLLSPGQQFQPNMKSSKVIEADTEGVTAWKNGYFLFKDEDIRSIMRKISRWYNVEVNYSGNIPDVGFGGNISRSKDINEVLNVLQLTNAVHFKVEGRRITVMR